MSLYLYHLSDWQFTAPASRSLAAVWAVGAALILGYILLRRAPERISRKKAYRLAAAALYAAGFCLPIIPAARPNAHASVPPAAEAALQAPAAIRPTAEELTGSGIVYNGAYLKELCEYAYPLPKLLLYRLGAEGAYAEAADAMLYWTWHTYDAQPGQKDEFEKALNSFSPERAAWLRRCIGNARSLRAKPFTGIMGCDGWYEDSGMIPPQLGAPSSGSGSDASAPDSGEQSGIANHYIRTYYAVINGRETPIAESFSFVIDDCAADLDGDGIKELICNCVYGGSGTRRVYVYRMNGGKIERGQPDYGKMELPGWEHWGAMSSASYYDAERGVFIVEYPGSDYPKTPERLIREACYDDFSWEVFDPKKS